MRSKHYRLMFIIQVNYWYGETDLYPCITDCKVGDMFQKWIVGYTQTASSLSHNVFLSFFTDFTSTHKEYSIGSVPKIYNNLENLLKDMQQSFVQSI